MRLIDRILSTCNINFDNESGIYCDGQSISGTAKLTTATKKTIRAIHIQVIGQAKVLWKDKASKKFGPKRILTKDNFTSEETLFNYRTYVVGQESGPSFDLDPGTHIYNFDYVLPQPLPPSFIGVYGSIEYFIIVTIDSPFRLNDVFQRSFTLISNLDLNLNPRYQSPDFRQDIETSSYWCCKSGPVKVKLTTPVTGYVPGQIVTFTCLVENESKYDIAEIVAGVRQDVRFSSDLPKKEIKSTSCSIVQKMIGSSLKMSKKEFHDSVLLPSIPQTTQKICRCIQISYCLYVQTETRWFTKGCFLTIPITIGAIPITQSPSNIVAQSTSRRSLASTSLPSIRTIQVIDPYDVNEFIISEISLSLTSAEPIQPAQDLPPLYSAKEPPTYHEAIKQKISNLKK